MEKALRQHDRQAWHLHDVASTHRDRQGLRLESSAMTIRADARRHIALNFLVYTLAVRLLVAPVKTGDHPFEVNGIGMHTPMLGCIANRQRLRRTIQHFLVL